MEDADVPYLIIEAPLSSTWSLSDEFFSVITNELVHVLRSRRKNDVLRIEALTVLLASFSREVDSLVRDDWPRATTLAWGRLNLRRARTTPFAG